MCALLTGLAGQLREGENNKSTLYYLQKLLLGGCSRERMLYFYALSPSQFPPPTTIHLMHMLETYYKCLRYIYTTRLFKLASVMLHYRLTDKSEFRVIFSNCNFFRELHLYPSGPRQAKLRQKSEPRFVYVGLLV